MGSSWTVVSQVPDQVLVGGAYVEGVDITVQLSDQSQLVVEVSNTDLQTVATVKAMIQAAVDLHDAVASLSGP
jgi:hypothetical protein